MGGWSIEGQGVFGKIKVKSLEKIGRSTNQNGRIGKGKRRRDRGEECRHNQGGKGTKVLTVSISGGSKKNVSQDPVGEGSKGQLQGGTPTIWVRRGRGKTTSSCHENSLKKVGYREIQDGPGGRQTERGNEPVPGGGLLRRKP